MGFFVSTALPSTPVLAAALTTVRDGSVLIEGDLVGLTGCFEFSYSRQTAVYRVPAALNALESQHEFLHPYLLIGNSWVRYQARGRIRLRFQSDQSISSPWDGL